MADSGAKGESDENVPIGKLVDLPEVHEAATKKKPTDISDSLSYIEDEVDLYSATVNSQPEDTLETFESVGFRPDELLESVRETKRPPKADFSTHVFLSQLNPITTESSLRERLEKPKVGGEIEYIHLDSDIHTARIKFKDPSVAAKVREYRTMIIDNFTVAIHHTTMPRVDSHGLPSKPDEPLRNPDQPQKRRLRESPDHTHVSKDMPEAKEEKISKNIASTIQVKGIHHKTTTETVENFFSNRKRSGGGNIKQATHCDCEAVITFHDREVAQRVLSRRSLYLEGSPLSISPIDNPTTGMDREDTIFIEADDDASENLHAHLSDDDEHKCDNVATDLNTDETCLDAKNLNEEPELPNEPQRVIKVKGINEQTLNDTLTYFFESKKRSGGGDVEEVVRSEGSTEAKITFKDPKDAANVLQHGPLTLEKSKLEVTLDTNENVLDADSQKNTVLVKGLKQSISFDTIECFFENKRRAGGGEIEEVNYNATAGEAKITFVNPEVAARVVKRENLKLENTPLTVSWWIDNKGEVSKLDAEDSSKEDFAIIVTGLTTKISDDTIQCFFENKKRTGGDATLVYKRLSENHARIAYENNETAKRVLENGNFTLDGIKLTAQKMTDFEPVKKEIPPRDTILVKGIGSQISVEVVSLFLENKRRSGGGPVSRMKYDPINETALVTFDNHEDANNVVQKGTLLLDGQALIATWPDIADKENTSDTAGSEQPLSRSLMIRGLNPKTPQNVIHMYFENQKRSGGGPIDGIQHDAMRGTAFITFKTADAAKSVLQKNDLKLEGYQLDVEIADIKAKMPKPAASIDEPKPVAAIEVSGFAESATEISEEMLRLFFENKRRSGGGDIKFINLDKDNGVAAITFMNAEDANEVLKKGTTNPFQLFGVPLNVRGLEIEVPAVSCAIEVKGFPADTNEDLLVMFFENRRRSGGEPIEAIHYDVPNRRAIITYQNIEAPQRVIQKQPLVLDGGTLKIKILQPARPVAPIHGPVDKDKILVSLLDEDTPTEDLVLFLQCTADCKVKQVQFGLAEGVALVEFDGIPDYDAVRKLVSLKPLSGRMLCVQQVPLPDSIQVHNICGVKEDLLSLYFENERRSGGGPINRVDFHKEEEYATIQFSDRKVLKRVVSRRHNLNNTGLVVKVYYECLGILPPGHDTSKPPTRLPSFLDITDTDTDVLAFIMSSQKKVVEQELANFDCEIQWPKNSKDPLHFVCTIKRDDRKASQKAKEWLKSVQDKWYYDLVKKYSKTTVDTLQHTWRDFLKRAGDLKKYQEDKVKIKTCDSTCSVEIWGLDEPVFKVANHLTEIQRKLEEELDHAKKSVTEQVTLKRHQLLMLRAIRFDLKEKEVFPNIEIKISNTEIVFTGLPNVITSAKLHMYEAVNSIVSENFPDVPESVCRLLKKKPVRDHIVNNFKVKNMRMTWDAGKKDLTVYAMNDSDLKTGVNVITKEVIEAKITVTDGSSVLETEQWRQLRQTLLSKFPDTLEINVNHDNGQICVASICNQCNLIIEDIKNFISENTILENAIVLDSGKYKFAKKAMAGEIGQIVCDLKSMLVDIQFKIEDDECLMVVKGNKYGMPPAEKKVQDLIGSIVSRDHDVNKPGMGKYFVSKRGQDFIMAVESRHSVTIQLVGDEKKKKHSHPGIPKRSLANTGKDQTYSKARLKNGTEVFVCLGDLTTHQVGAIVNAANKDLQHYGGLARAIVDKGGYSIQTECDAKIRSGGKMLEGQVFVSSAGKLPCKNVLHAVGPVWQGGHRNEINLIYEAIYQCLTLTVEKRLDSVGIPALSAGVFGVPLHVSTNTIVSAIKDYCENQKEATKLGKVYLVDNQRRTMAQFHKSLQSILGNSEVELVDGTPAPKKAVLPRSVATAAAPSTKNLFTKVNDKTLVTSKGVHVNLAIGGIEQQKVDVIVNTTSKNIDGNSGVTAAIIKAAGPGLQLETQQFVPLNPGSLAVTSGQNLQCKHIYHVSCSGWDGHNGKCERFIKQIIADSLKTADQAGLTSIAFPAIGTGNNNVPRDKCAELLYHEVAMNPHTSVNDVRFVIYNKDTETIKAFEAEMRRQANPPKATMGRSRALMERSLSLTEEAMDTGENDYVMVQSGAPVGNALANISGLQVTLGPVELQLELGDITLESTDAIVNSTDKTIDLTMGGVAKALAKAGGHQFVQECKQAVMVDNITTTSGGNLRAQNVIHIVAQHNTKQWKKVIKKSLEEAERQNFRSLTFPALGTGQLKAQGSAMASVMLDTIAEFADNKPSSLRLVRIVIYPGQPHILDTFREEITKKATHDKKKSWWKTIKEAVSGLYNSLTDVDMPTQSLEPNMRLPTLKVLPPPAPVTKLRVCARTMVEIDAVIKEIEDVCDEESKDKVMDKEADQENIAKLDDTQIARIQSLDQTYGVKITIENRPKVKRIRLQGSSEDISSVVEKIYAIFMENNRKAHAKSKAVLVKKQVQWYYEDSGDYEEYPEEINSKIEEAFDSKLPDIQWTEQDGEKFKIDFKAMVETQSGSAGARVKVIRKAKGGGVEVPPNWTTVDPNKHFELVALQTSSAEYQDVENKLKATAGGHINNIISIERVQNTSLFQQYAVHRDSMMKANPTGSVENILWHGTSADTLESINRYGFNRSYCGKNAVALGNGVYFAKNASYSCSSTYSRPDPKTGHKHIYMCKVLTGDIATGSGGMKVPPVKSGAILYDSVVDNVSNPSMYVIFNDTQAYPEYHITFS